VHRQVRLASPHKTMTIAGPSPSEVQKRLLAYQTAEQKAPANVKQALVTLRQQITTNHRTYQVGATAVAHRNLGKITGEKNPQIDLNALAAMNAARAAKAHKPNLINLTLHQRVSPPAAFMTKENARVNGGESGGTSGPTSAGTNQNGDNSATFPSSQFPSTSSSAFSWRDRMTPVKDQGDCGSCWAFATTGVLEANEILFAGQGVLDLAEQQLVNCTPNPYGSDNCDGNSASSVWKYLSKGDSDALESAVPYQGKVLSCNSGAANGSFKVADWSYVGSNPEWPTPDEIKAALVAHGPVAASVNANSAFQHYSGGVFDDSDSNQTNHLISIVGWDDSKGAWHIRNSWTENWGEGGYMWIKYGVNGIGHFASWAEPTHPPPPQNPTFSDRYVSITNDSGEALNVSLEAEVSTGWVPASGGGNAWSYTLPAGATLDVKRKDNSKYLTAKTARIWAKSADGKHSYNQYKDTDLVLVSTPYQATKRDRITYHFKKADAPVVTADSLLNDANGARGAGDYAKAETLYQHWVDTYPNDPRIHNTRFLLGFTQYKAKKYQDSTTTLYNAIQLAPQGDENTPFSVYYMAMGETAEGYCGYAVRNFDMVAHGELDAPADWVQSAKDNIKALENDDGTICSNWD
jgi:C1A family cysteine protease